MWYSEYRYKWKIYRLSWTRQHQIVTYYFNVTKNLQRLDAFQLNILSWTANKMFFSLRGQPFDSEGGGLAFFWNKYSGLEKAENK